MSWEEIPQLYEVARKVCHDLGMPWTDPRTGITHQPPKEEIMTEEQCGSGVTTKQLMADLQRTTSEQFRDAMKPLLRKPREADLASDAFKDGMRTMLRHLVEMGVVKVLEK